MEQQLHHYPVTKCTAHDVLAAFFFVCLAFCFCSVRLEKELPLAQLQKICVSLCLPIHYLLFRRCARCKCVNIPNNSNGALSLTLVREDTLLFSRPLSYALFYNCSHRDFVVVSSLPVPHLCRSRVNHFGTIRHKEFLCRLRRP